MKLIPTLLLAGAFSGTAFAADEAPAATQWSLLDGSNGKAVYSTESGSPALVLGCSEAGKISATFSLDGNVMDKMEARSKKTRVINGSLAVEEADADKAKWIYLKRRNMAAPIEGRYARRIYNAAVTGKSVTIDLGRQGSYEYAPPKLNGQFKAFADGCSAS
ncbi:MAG: hypothetical protein HRT80_13645 [Henriciella sp.]|nr:hypothetical protein [Henriciella sp.]